MGIVKELASFLYLKITVIYSIKYPRDAPRFLRLTLVNPLWFERLDPLDFLSTFSCVSVSLWVSWIIIIIIIVSIQKSFVGHRPSPGVVHLGRLWAKSYYAGPVRVGRCPFSRLLRHIVTYVGSILFMSPYPQGTWFQVFVRLLVLGLYSMIRSTRKLKLLPAVIAQAVITARKSPHDFNVPEPRGGSWILIGICQILYI